MAAALLAMFACLTIAPAASAETRTLKLYFVHTRERAEITYKRNGRYLQDGLNQINRFLRDWRRNEPTKMDPRLLDVLWETYQRSGSRDYIHVISAYRSPATNAMLRKRSRGVANKSQHMLGKAIDFYLPDVKLAKLRRIGLTLQSGGVGYYPRSGSPFVHLDVGSVRHWPRMSRSELMAMFPDGKTLHVPSDGKPLPGYQQALAAYKSRAKLGGGPIVSGGGTAVASADSGGKRGGGFLSAFFGGGEDKDEDEADSRTAVAAAPKAIPAPEPVRPEPSADTPAVIIASLPDRSVPIPLFAPRPSAEPQGVAAMPGDTETGDATLAVNVPYPTPRPADAPGAEIAIAMQSGDPTGLDEARRILDGALVMAAIPAELSFVPQPAPRADDLSVPVVLASLPPAALPNGSLDEPETTGTAVVADGKSRRDIAAQSEDSASGGGRLSSESLRQYMIASLDGATALAIGARTTEKADRPAAGDSRRDRKARIIPLPNHVSNRALNRAPISRVTARTPAPTFTFSAANSAPSIVYTAGFSTEQGAPDPSRFSGTAVTFLSVAKFD